MIEVYIESNFVMPGLENGSIEMEEGSALRGLLEDVSDLSGGQLVFFQPGRDTLDHDGWEVDLNGISHEIHRAGLDAPLKEGDVVAIRLLPLCGG